MRIIRVDEDESDNKTLLWVAAGAVIGLVAGALAAEKLGGRRLTARNVWRRSRSLAELAIDRWEPLLGAAMAVRNAWNGRAEFEEALDEDEDEDESADERADKRADEGADERADEGAEPVAVDQRLDARVLEAFANDPILSERAVEIEEDGDGRILLHGRVHAAREVALAVTIARGVPGVSDVRQRLRVRDRR